MRTSTRKLKHKNVRKLSLVILDKQAALTPRRKFLANKAAEKKEQIPNYRENLRKVTNLPIRIEIERNELELKLKMNKNYKTEETKKEPQREENEEGRKKENCEGRKGRKHHPAQVKGSKEEGDGASKLSRKVPETEKF